MTSTATAPPPFALRGLVGAVALRVLGGIALLLVISILVFLLVRLTPGDIVTNLLGPKHSAAAEAAVIEKYRLNDPALTQYLVWLGNALSGDWGTSFRQQAPVATIVSERAGVTLTLVVVSFVLAVVIAIPAGVLSARRAGTWRDTLTSAVSVLGISAPAFVVSYLLMYVFASQLRWFPLYGYGDGGLDTLWHLALPATALAIGLAAMLTKITRTVMIRELAKDYVTFGRARGLSERHLTGLALRNSLIPLVTSSGLLITFLVAGTILVETVFALPGIGRLLYDAVIYKDLPTVQAATVLIAAVIVIVSLLVDVSYSILDPRVRRRTEAS